MKPPRLATPHVPRKARVNPHRPHHHAPEYGDFTLQICESGHAFPSGVPFGTGRMALAAPRSPGNSKVNKSLAFVSGYSELKLIASGSRATHRGSVEPTRTFDCCTGTGDEEMDQAKSKLSDNVGSELDALRADVARLSAQLSAYIDEEKTTWSRFLAREAKHAKSALDGKLGDVGAKASEYGDAAKHQAEDLQKATLDYVNRKPLQALAIAAGIGLVLGMWSKGRS